MVTKHMVILTTYTKFERFPKDQAVDSSVLAKIREGDLPTLGPRAAFGEHSILPTYYYLAFIMSLGSVDPVWQAFHNALLSFLTIPLLIYFILLLINDFKSNRAWLVASCAGLWLSSLYNGIIYANLEWNPSSIPFFSLLFLILCKIGVENILNSEFTSPRKNTFRNIIIWSGIGLVTAILGGLHSTSLLISLAALGAIQIFLFYRKKNMALTVLSSWISFIVLNIPYISGEVHRGWQNTNSLIQLILKPSLENHTFFERLDRSFFNYFELGDMAYFNSGEIANISHIFMVSVLILALVKFKGSRVLWACSWLVWVLYSYSVSNYWGYIFMHYKFLIFLSPIIFTAVYFYYFNIKKISNVFLAILILLFSIFSMYINTLKSIKFVENKFGEERLANTDDIISALQSLPDNSTVCVNPELDLAYQYIAKYNLKDNKKIQITKTCDNPEFIKVQYKFTQDENLKLHKTDLTYSNIPIKILFNNEAILMYQTTS